jgi:ketosteroid isomerase-like protein
VRAINRQDVEELAELMTETHRFVDSLDNVVEGRERMRAAWKSYFGMVPDYTIAVEETFRDGPIVVLLGTAQGTYAGGGQLTPENHWETPVALRAFVEGGKVAEWRVYADNEPMRRLMARVGQGK